MTRPVRHFRYNLWGAGKGHPQTVMLEGGVTWLFSVPRSIGDQWWFLGCTEYPENLPAGVEIMTVSDPHNLVGHGLDKDMARKLADLIQTEDYSI